MQGVQAANEYVSTTTPEGRIVTVTAINPYVVKVTNAAAGEQPLASRGTVEQKNAGQIASVVTLPTQTAVMTTTGGVVAMLNKLTGEVTIIGQDNRVIRDSGKRCKTEDGMMNISLTTTSTGSMYGAGERGHKFNMRGDTLVMFNRQDYGYTEGDPRISQMGITMPLFLSSDGFAIVFDDYARAEMVLSNPIEYITENPKPVAYYYVNGGETLADLCEHLSGLTGRQDLTPFWSLGYITSKYGYHTQEETVCTIDTLQQAGYPVDGIVLDLFWYGKEQDMGRLAWEPTQWPDPVQMLSDLKKRGVNLVAISQPYVLRNGRAIDNYNELKGKGLLLLDSTGATQEVKIWVGEGGMFDVSNPATRQWLSDRYGMLTDMGITGWWGDLGEPEVHPFGAVHHNGLATELYHNQYGNDWSEIIYDLFKEKYPNTRLMTMMRGGTTGLQRYSVYPWSTDVSRSWGGLQPQVKIMLNSGLSGLGYMGHDVGGFAVDRENPYLPELYVRWLQVGLFTPILRTHAQFKAEPYNYPQYSEIIEGLIKDRYRWLPYNYTLAYENAAKGYPLVRPLNFTENTTRYDEITDEYLWGSEVLVAPVMTEGATSREVTFPAGVWVDALNPKVTYAGHTTVEYNAPLEVLPLFYKGGAFIPTAEYKMNNTGEYNSGKLTVNYYPVSEEGSEYVLFDDDRISTNTIAEGKYRTITFTGSAGGSRITVKAEGEYAGAPQTIELTLVVNRAASNATFRVNGRLMKPKYDAEAGTLTLKLKWRTERQLVIESNNLTLCSQE